MSGDVTIAVHMRAVACQRLKCKQTEQLGEKMLTEQVYKFIHSVLRVLRIQNISVTKYS